ncbi:8-amino-7-oxononanoate synthase [Flavobacterium limnosediminis JC2902]|uniref:8-amino-7-oxononanoate synthase n=1 Tax=Flavobacterium limnosediminis JC2902 TaxID=1341181 RepID=V6ST53_9FLAO|nr:GNAT family N-acetyltransferase [Flavobacterium limnosediminis]ESU29352.1 8-amino-7-oxononanoate synthase [Flavobacterium limnosediminis JC2902]
MKQSYHYKIYSSVAELPESWDTLSVSNIFLSGDYLKVMDNSAPKNMICHYIGLFKDDELTGIALSQFLDLNLVSSFGERDTCIKTSVRNFVFRNFTSHVLFVGNNMLTGQNAYIFSENLPAKEGISLLHKAVKELQTNFKKQGKKIHLTTFKDFFTDEKVVLEASEFHSFYKFSTQPNMIFPIAENWKSEDDYVAALSKKYRDQYKRAHKKLDGIEKRKMPLAEIEQHNATIHNLYMNVARNAPFNTFFLAENHFYELKKQLGHNFLFYGYFLEDKLIGFNTLIKNGATIDTYFLGYDDEHQREMMVYLNMLYDMIKYSIKKQYKEIIFARTALEIKSSVGAKPHEMVGFIQHSNPLINRFAGKIFKSLEPETVWQERNPFK